MSALTAKLLEENRLEDLKKSLEDTAFREKMYEEFGLKSDLKEEMADGESAQDATL